MSVPTAVTDIPPALDPWGEGGMSVAQASVFTGMSRSDLYERMTRGEVAYAKVGRRRILPRRALRELLRKNSTQPVG